MTIDNPRARGAAGLSRRRSSLRLAWISLMLVALVAGLAALQYRWLGQVSAAERDRMRASVRERAAQVAEAFDREITRAYFGLQIDSDMLDRRDWATYAERIGEWRAAAAHPQIVTAILLVTKGADGVAALQRFDETAKRFVAAAWPDRGAPLRRWVETGPPWLQPIWDEVPALVLPTPDVRMIRGNVRIQTIESRAGRAWVIAMLDGRYLAEELLPALIERHFGSNAGLEYEAIVRDRDDPARIIYASDRQRTHAAGTADASEGIFDLRLADLHAVARAESGGGEPKRFAISIFQRGPLRTRADGGGPLSGADPRWELALHHRAGSLEAAVAGVRRRNLLLSSGILALLVSSIGLVLLSARRAERLAAQQVEFVAAVSHELRTPLAVIRSAGENLADGVVAEPAQVQRYGALVREEGQRLTDLVEQVLAFAGIQSPRAAEARRPSAVGDLVARALAETRETLDREGVCVETDLASDLPPVLVDQAALVRALVNLLTNAIKYGGEAKWIGVAGRGSGKDGTEVTITVADRGIGIAPADLPRVFEPFYRAASVVARIHGTGLGLAVVQGIARAHGGRVSVASAPGKGSAFTIHLPVARAGTPVATGLLNTETTGI